MVPSFGEFVKPTIVDDESNHFAPTGAQASPTDSGNRLQFALSQFLKDLCEHQTVVLFLDDLQWADVTTLELLVSLMTTTNISNLLFIGTFRDNEADDFHELTEALSTMRQNGRTCVSMSLGNLPIAFVGFLIADALDLETSETEALTKVLYAKTQGIIFFIIQSLQKLERDGILTYSFMNNRWEWVQERLTTEMELSANVVDVVVSKIMSLPRKAQLALSVASFLRSKFDAKILGDILVQEHYISDQADLSDILGHAVMEGLLDREHIVFVRVQIFARQD